MNGISAVSVVPGRHAARASTSDAATSGPPAWRRTFSRRTLSVFGAPSRSTRSAIASSRKISGRPGPSAPRAPNGSDPVTVADPRCRWLDSSRGTVSLKAWRGAADDPTDEPPRPPDAAVLDDLRRRGIDLDPDGHG